MRPHHFQIGSVGVAVLLIGYLFLPRQEERATMLARDGLYETALREMTVPPAESRQRPQYLMQVHALRMMQGDIGKALEALGDYLDLRPDDWGARQMRAELLLQTGQLDAHLTALADLVALRPGTAEVAHLLGLYRLHDRFESELALLEKFAGSKYLDHAHHERLGALHAARGDWVGAERWLAFADRSAPPPESAGRLLLLDVLVQSKKIDEANRRALALMDAWRDPYLGGKLLLIMSQSGTGGANELAHRCVDLMPEATFDIAGVLTRKGQAAVAQAMLAHWAARNAEPTGEQFRDYVYSAIQAGEHRGPYQLLVRLSEEGAAPVARARLAEELANAYGKAALAPLRSLLPAHVLRTRPVFAAELALFEGNKHLARWFLSEADPMELAAELRQNWLTQLRRVETPHAVFRRLVAFWQEGRLPPELLRELAVEALRHGQPRLHDEIWASLQR